MLALIFIIIALPIVGVLLLRRGWKGYAIDDHPVCRKCDFDLTGKATDSTRCPECGADLSPPKAIRIGHRRKRKAPLAMGAFCLLLFAIALVPRFFAVNWVAYAPTWWLTRQITSTVQTERSEAIAELGDRIIKGKLSDAQ